MYLDELKYCFQEDFTKWLMSGSNVEIKELRLKNRGLYKEDYILDNHMDQYFTIENRVLNKMLSILAECPDIIVFWYGADGKLHYSIDINQRPYNGIYLDTDRVKSLIRDIKINQVLRY